MALHTVHTIGLHHPVHTSKSGSDLNAESKVMVFPLPGGPQSTIGLCSASHVLSRLSCRTVSRVGTTTSGEPTLCVSTSIFGTLPCHEDHSPLILTYSVELIQHSVQPSTATLNVSCYPQMCAHTTSWYTVDKDKDPPLTSYFIVYDRSCS